MKRLFPLTITMCWIVSLFCLCTGCDQRQEIVMTPEGTFTPSYLRGREIGRQYAEQALPDYEVVWNLHDVRTDLRDDFLDGFASGLGQADNVAACRRILREALTGNQFDSASELGIKHAARAVTNEQIQGTLHSSLGVSRGVALGWKAGYIKGYASQRLADTAAAATVNESRIREFHAEAAASYHALRAAIGP